MKPPTGLSGLVEENKGEMRKASFRRAATVLAIAACFPFLALAISSFQVGRDSAVHETLIDIFRAWSIIVLSFMGGTRWGMAVQREEAMQLNLWMSILIPCVAWLCFFLPDNFMVPGLLVAYCGMGAWDSISANNGLLPVWFGKVRIIMTLLIAFAHIIAFVSLF